MPRVIDGGNRPGTGGHSHTEWERKGWVTQSSLFACTVYIEWFTGDHIFSGIFEPYSMRQST